MSRARLAALVGGAPGLALIAFGARLVVALWARGDVPPAEDGRFYDVVARRLADGLGYTWAWPDGAVTFAAHYPIGYPALLAALRVVTGAELFGVFVAQAALGALATLAVADLAGRAAAAGSSPLAEHGARARLIAGLGFALHPGVVLYTPALMTEVVAGELLVLSAWAVRTGGVGATDDGGSAGAARRWVGWLLGGVLAGLTVLVRPQLALVVPLLGWFGAEAAPRAAPRRTEQGGPGGTGSDAPASVSQWRHRALVVALVTAIAAAVVVPWTLRNCQRLGRCVPVSANGGWNLLIGALPEGRGTFVPITPENVPAPCRTVFDEAGKDACFGEAGRALIASAPLAWLGRIPAKLGATFNHGGAAGAYLASAAPERLSATARRAWHGVDLVWQRALLLLALVGLGRGAPARGDATGAVARARATGLRRGLAWASAPWLFTPWAWPAWVGLTALLALEARRGATSALRAWASLAGGAVASTLLVHAVFFGATRYALVLVPVLAVTAGVAARTWGRPAAA